MNMNLKKKGSAGKKKAEGSIYHRMNINGLNDGLYMPLASTWHQRTIICDAKALMRAFRT
jgi:hypothetical protein